MDRGTWRAIVHGVTKELDMTEVTEHMHTYIYSYLPEVWETWVRSLGQDNPLEKGMATHSSILAWRIPWTEEPGKLQSMGLQRVRHN